MQKILDRYNLNPKFSLLHTAIDNNVNGHGRYSRDAVEEYLEQIQLTEGDEAVQQHWKRIWIGFEYFIHSLRLSFYSFFKRYVAYGMTGDIDRELRQLYEKQNIQTPRDEFIQLIKKKAPAAQVMHGVRRVGPTQYLLNDLFASGDAETICDEL